MDEVDRVFEEHCAVLEAHAEEQHQLRLKRNRDYYRSHKQELADYKRRWNALNFERKRETLRAWHERHPTYERERHYRRNPLSSEALERKKERNKIRARENRARRKDEINARRREKTAEDRAAGIPPKPRKQSKRHPASGTSQAADQVMAGDDLLQLSSG